MDRSEVEKRVVKVVCQVLGVEPEMVKPESHFVFDLGAESTQSVELVAAFEHEFRMEMDEDAALEVQTVGDAVDFISQEFGMTRSVVENRYLANALRLRSRGKCGDSHPATAVAGRCRDISFLRVNSTFTLPLDPH